MRQPWFTARYTRRVAVDEWEIYLVDEVRDWIDGLDPAPTPASCRRSTCSPRPAQGSVGRWWTRFMARRSPTSKSCAPGTVRILFAFDPWRSSILLVAGDKAGRWNEWYAEAIPLAEQRYETYLKERAEEEGSKP